MLGRANQAIACLGGAASLQDLRTDTTASITAGGIACGEVCGARELIRQVDLRIAADSLPPFIKPTRAAFQVTTNLIGAIRLASADESLLGELLVRFVCSSIRPPYEASMDDLRTMS